MTQKKDKYNYRPWRFLGTCYSCGMKLKNKDNEPKFCDPCIKKIEEGHDLW